MSNDGFVCIIPGPTEVIKTEPAGDRWCFAERKRFPHTWELLTYPQPEGDEIPDEGWPGWYYEPLWVRRCSSCGKDRSHFGDGW
jgi:hypothetical protein